MDRSTFWKIIDTSRKKAKRDPNEQLERLRERLEDLDPAAIVEFGTIFNEYSSRAYTWELWAAAYLIGGGCSDDGFLDFRGWLISKGEKVYERALKDPQSLGRVVKDDEDCQHEGFQYVAARAWKNKHGPDGSVYPDPGMIHPLEPAGVPWSEAGDDLERRFPNSGRDSRPHLVLDLSEYWCPHQARLRRPSARPGWAVSYRWSREPIVPNRVTPFMA